VYLPSGYTGSNTLVVSSKPGCSRPDDGCSYEAPHKAVPARSKRCAGHRPQEGPRAGALGRPSGSMRADRALAGAIVVVRGAFLRCMHRYGGWASKW